MEKVLTLIAPRGALAPEHQAKVAAALRDAGAEIGAAAPLAAAEAADIPFAGLPLEVADRAARGALEGSPVDAIAQEAAGRRKRLLIADMDSTMVTSETLDELAGEAGLKDEISAITRRAMNGELDFEGALRERVGMLKGLALEALERTWAATALMPGAEELVAIVDIQLAGLQKRLAQRRLELQVSLPAKEWLAQRGFDPVYGARPLRRLVQQAIGDQLAKMLLAGEVHDGDVVPVNVAPDGDSLILG